MTNILKASAMAILVTGLTISAATVASAASVGGGYGNGGKGGGYGGGGNANPGGGNDLKQQQTYKQPILQTTIKRYRRPEYVTGHSCDWLYNLITRSNMLKTVPAYQKCIQENGS